MRIAITYKDGKINDRFGQVKTFKLYDIENGAVKEQSFRECNAADLDGKAAVLIETGADKLICGNICMHCQENVRNAGIDILGCVYGDADAAVSAFLSGTLRYETDPDILQ